MHKHFAILYNHGKQKIDIDIHIFLKKKKEKCLIYTNMDAKLLNMCSKEWRKLHAIDKMVWVGQFELRDGVLCSWKWASWMSGLPDRIGGEPEKYGGEALFTRIFDRFAAVLCSFSSPIGLKLEVCLIGFGHATTSFFFEHFSIMMAVLSLPSSFISSTKLLPILLHPASKIKNKNNTSNKILEDTTSWKYTVKCVLIFHMRNHWITVSHVT